MRPELGRAAEEVIVAIQRDVPEYARPNDDIYTSTVRRAVHQAVRQFVLQIADPGTSREATAQLFRDIGRIEAAEGRSLEPLQAALRLGARVTWRMLCEQAVRGSLSIDAIGPVGEALFLYLDELAAACSEGFAQASAEAAGELDRRRRRLLDLIVTDPPVSREAVADLARAAGWPLPRRVAVVALEDRGQEHFGPLPALPPDVLVDVARKDPCLLVPDADGPGRAEAVERGLRGWTGALGPSVPVARAASSLRWARHALALARRGVIGPAAVGRGVIGPGAVARGQSLIRCEEHLATLLLSADEELARLLSSVRLAPLARLRPVQQDVLAETLLAWLQNAGNARLAAGQLHVHPQTVRYRLRQIQDLFGPVLGEPGARFELEVALRARGLLRARPVPPQPAPPGRHPPGRHPRRGHPQTGPPRGDQPQGGA
jgi:PucR C-terminal helix-turn-helix domain